ncbi:alpha/beta hydrolase fold domain-containing protein [Streptomyces sp. GLT-R25]
MPSPTGNSPTNSSNRASAAPSRCWMPSKTTETSSAYRSPPSTAAASPAAPTAPPTPHRLTTPGRTGPGGPVCPSDPMEVPRVRARCSRTEPGSDRVRGMAGHRGESPVRAGRGAHPGGAGPSRGPGAGRRHLSGGGRGWRAGNLVRTRRRPHRPRPPAHSRRGLRSLASAHVDRKLAGHIAKAAGAPVLVLDFRRAPEHKYPAQVDDAEAAFNWLLSEGYEPGNIITIGHSIGGFIAVALALRLRDKKQPLPGAIVSISPWCDLEIANETITANAETDKILSKDLLEFFRDAWIGGTGVEFTDTRINLNRADLSGLPPTLVSWGTYEVLAGEGRGVRRPRQGRRNRHGDRRGPRRPALVRLRCRPGSGDRHRHRTDRRVGPGEDEDLTERYGPSARPTRTPTRRP